MTTVAPGVGRGSNRGWDLLLAAGLIAALPNLAFTAFTGGWTSVAAHGSEAEAVGPLQVMLNYAPFAVALAVVVAAVVFRVRRRVRLAAVLMSLHLAVLAMVGGLFLPVLF